MSLWAAAALTVLTAAGAERRALVVAFNDSDRPGVAHLQYADDDGLLWSELLERLGYQTVLLTVPDVDTARRGSPFLARARPPTTEALQAAVEQLREANRAARAQGRSTDTLFVYVGHGELDEAGRAYLTLLGARLHREALLEQVVDRLDADFLHVIVDACHASGVVGGRGGDGEALQKLQALLQREAQRTRPTLGTAFAESDTGKTHEWSRLRAGVFSHIVRSALQGAADVNGDGDIEYSELESFAAAALAGVSEAPARLRLRLSAPPQDPRRPLVSAPPPGPTLRLPARPSPMRISVSDDQGTRLVDLHRPAGEATLLHLPVRTAYWVSTPEGDAKIPAHRLHAGLPALSAQGLASRGSEAASLAAGLFQVPFSRAFYDGFVAQAELVPVRFEEGRTPALAHPSGWTGLELGATVGQAPLGVAALSFGPFIAWRSDGAPFRFGARGLYGISPRAWIANATLHRVSLLGSLGYETDDRLSPTAELAAGLTMIGVTGAMGPQADLTVPSARLSVGARWRLGPFTLRAALGLSSDFAELDGLRRLMWLPSLDVGVER